MAGKRVHQLSKELGIPSKELLDLLQSMGEDISNPLSSVSDDLESSVRKKLAEDKPAKAKAAKAKTTKTEKKPAKTKAKTAKVEKKPAAEKPKKETAQKKEVKKKEKPAASKKKETADKTISAKKEHPAAPKAEAKSPKRSLPGPRRGPRPGRGNRRRRQGAPGHKNPLPGIEGEGEVNHRLRSPLSPGSPAPSR